MLLTAFPTFASYAQSEPADNMYSSFFPQAQCDSIAFRQAWRGYTILLRYKLIQNPHYLTIIDFTKRSNEFRLFVLDVPARRLVLASITAHGAGSDPDSSAIPQRFGNTDGSRMSSVGFYITGDTYTNHRPGDSLGLCLFGLDKGYNDAAAAREIVMHYGATEYAGRIYVTDSGAARSSGCPAMPLSTNSRVINLIKGGSCLFIYSGKVAAYARQSTVLNEQFREDIIQQGPPPNNCSCKLSPHKP